MPMFGMRPPMLDEEQRRLAQMAQSGGMGEQPISMTRGAQQMLRDAPVKTDAQQRQSYWQGGDKFTLRDGIGGALAAIGDGFSEWANGPSAGGAVEQLTLGRLSAIKQAKEAQKAAAEAAARQAAAARLGYSPDEMAILGDKIGTVQADRMKPPTPPTPDSFERALIGAGIDPKSPQAQELFRRRAENMASAEDEFVVVPIPGRGTYAGPKSGLPSVFGQGGGAPPANQSPPPRLPADFFDRNQTPTPPRMQMTPEGQYYLDEAKKQEMLEEARNYGRGYMKRMGY